MSIKILPARLANQIAAGEVVERPASVLKELLENSIDAGATQIEIDIEKGGHKKIKITDNGSGIVKDELTLALSRHATSKVSDLEDLESICTLGFRGEALASISSVSRLTLTSRTSTQTEAWQAHSEGRDMQVVIEPAAHPVGTSVEVLDLFFNTPARRKFLRTEKTEFNHIEELFNRIALSRYDVGLRLKHNGKVLKNLPAIGSDGDPLKRVKQLCGASTCDGMLEIDGQYQGFRLKGWLSGPGHYRAMNDVQYVFVNNRMMRDKLIFHAIRQSYEGLLPDDKFPYFILYLEVPHKEVDVNVHPAKHEVRFHQSRLVHDFIFSIINEGLGQAITGQSSNAKEPSDVSGDEDSLIGKGSLDKNHMENGSTPEISAVREAQPGTETNAHTLSFKQEHGYVPHQSHQVPPQPDTEYIQPLHPLAQSRVQSHGGNEVNNRTSKNRATTAPAKGYNPGTGQGQQISQAAQNYSNLMTVPAGNYSVESSIVDLNGSGLNSAESSVSPAFNAATTTDVLVVNGVGVLVCREKRFYLVKQNILLINEVNSTLSHGISQPLLLPVAVALDSDHLENSHSEESNVEATDIKKWVNDTLLPIIEPYSIDLQLTGNKLILKQVPAGTRNQNWQHLLTELIENLPISDSSHMAMMLANNWLPSRCIGEIWQALSSQNQEQILDDFAIEVSLKEWLQGF